MILLAHPQGDLDDQRHRIREQRDPKADAEPQDLPQCRLRTEDHEHGHPRGFAEMGHADPQLEKRPELLGDSPRESPPQRPDK
jgi:hypothetical protein